MNRLSDEREYICRSQTTLMKGRKSPVRIRLSVYEEVNSIDNHKLRLTYR